MNNKLKYINPNDYQILSKSFQISDENKLEQLDFDDFINPISTSIPKLDIKLLKELYIIAIKLDSKNSHDAALIVWDRFDEILGLHLQTNTLCLTDSFDEVCKRFSFNILNSDRFVLKVLYDLGLYYEKNHAFLEAEKIWSKITYILKPYFYKTSSNKIN